MEQRDEDHGVPVDACLVSSVGDGHGGNFHSQNCDLIGLMVVGHSISPFRFRFVFLLIAFE